MIIHPVNSVGNWSQCEGRRRSVNLDENVFPLWLQNTWGDSVVKLQHHLMCLLTKVNQGIRTSWQVIFPLQFWGCPPSQAPLCYKQIFCTLLFIQTRYFRLFYSADTTKHIMYRLRERHNGIEQTPYTWPPSGSSTYWKVGGLIVCIPHWFSHRSMNECER